MSPILDSTEILYVVVASAIVLTVVGTALRKVVEPKFKPARLLNKSEERLHRNLLKLAPSGWSLTFQTSYGTFLSCRSRKKYWTMNAKRADFLYCDQDFQPVAVIEYQGSGHYGSTQKSKKAAMKRDAQKRKSLSEAGIPLIEVPARYDTAFLQEAIGKIAFPNQATQNPIVNSSTQTGSIHEN